MQDGGVIPDSGFPRDGGMANEERAKTNRSRCKTRASHSTHAIGPRRSFSAVIPSKRAFLERFESSREVDVHGRCGSSGTRSFSERYLTNPTSSGRR